MAMKQRYPSALLSSTGEPMAQDQESGADPVPVKFSVKTLGELGANLPVGLASPSGPRLRPFRVRPYKMKQEKALARLKDEMKGVSMGKFVCEALAMMYQTVGQHNFDTMKDMERQLVINQMTMPDVLYMYLYLRFSALGDEPVTMQIRCPKCSNEYKWYGDLASLEVKMASDDMPLQRKFTLREPIEVRGKTCKTLTLGLIKWDSFCKPDFQKVGATDAATISASIVGMDCFENVAEGTFQLAGNDLDDMSRYDMSALISDIEQNTPGPQLDVQPQCPACNFSSKMMLNWSWDNFFSLSVRPSPGK